jgi:hypothetical protein
MIRIFLGLLKGGLVGAAFGFGAARLGLSTGALAWPAYGALGFLVGVVCGKPPWRQETLWTTLMKGIIGFVMCMGLYWVAQKVLGGIKAPSLVVAELGLAADTTLASTPVLLAPLIGIVYGIFVEVDDGGKTAVQNGAAKPKR